MDDFPGLLARDFGYKPQGKSAPMAPPRSSSGSAQTRPAAFNKSGPVFDDHDNLLFNDVVGGPRESRGGNFDYESIFKDKNAKTSSLPSYDKPVYDDDIFDGLPGVKNASSSSHSARFDDVFTKSKSPFDDLTSASFGKKSDDMAFDDLLGNLGKKETGARKESDSPVFDDLLGGFGRSTLESNQSRRPSTSAKTTSNVLDDPFVVLESTSTPPASSTGLFTDPLDEISRYRSSASSRVNNSSANRGVFEDIDPLDSLGKSVPPMSPEANKKGKERSPPRSGPSVASSYAPTGGEPVDKYPVKNAEDFSQKERPVDDFEESHETLFDMPAAATDFRGPIRQTFSPPPYENASPNETILSPRSENVAESSDDVWITVSEIPLFTQPTSAPPPSRPPPPRPPQISKSERSAFSSNNSRKKMNEYSFLNSIHNSQSPRSAQARSPSPSPIDELDDAMGRTQIKFNDNADFFSGGDAETNSSAAAASAAAMKEAMVKAEAKFRLMREKEHLKSARSRDSGQVDRDMQDAQQRETRERQERLDRERQQREREEEERELRRLEKESEIEKEREREREEKEREQRRLERERVRQVVERATREARERAATEARLKAERAAVEKAAAEARERAERVAVQRAQAEARERAAAEAKERAERAAAEARERANSEAREKVEARARAERAAVERAAAEARERAAAAARANQQRNENFQKNNENNWEAFFRPSTAPGPRANSSDPFSDTQSKAAPETARRTSVGATSSMRKTSSTTNIVDDLSSIFGAPANSGEFQEVEGETDERRRARLERHQRTQERVVQALAEKNERDLQAQREQAERHRIAETLDVEIKRWAAGKEGNLRALLSTMQYVLWPECGWQPVSLTDLITAAAVKRVYRRATLCIHPDKVQQKGANLQQKYIAEKVFDLLKEAWNKFNSEELF